MNKKVLFLVASPYQLFNAIVIRMTIKKECSCDILLRSAITWNENVIDRVCEEGIFDNILRPEFTERESRFWELSDEEKEELVKDPVKYYGEAPIQPIYDEMFAALDAAAWKLIYYYQVLNGKKPDLYQFDEGIRSYSIEFGLSDDKPFYKGHYEENSYSKGIKGIYLYKPELYAVKEYDYELFKIPNPREDENVKNMLLKVFGKQQMPEEKYIYFEDYFFTDRFPTNDLELFKQVAEVVGKEEIVVKTHPRVDYNRFQPLGYKTIGNSNVPWEVQLLNGGIGSKVLISVTSTSIFTPYIIFDQNIHVISLEKLFRWEVSLHKDKAFGEYMKKLREQMNSEKVRFHKPSSIMELREILRFIRIDT